MNQPDGSPPQSVGKKYDEKKLKWSLLPFDALTRVVEVLDHGAKKYGENNWRNVEQWRYKEALLRHVIAYQFEEIDPDSGLPHLAHVATNALFLLHFAARGRR